MLNYGAVIQRSMYSPDLPGYQYSTYSHTIRPGNVVAGDAKWNDWQPTPPLSGTKLGTPGLQKKRYGKAITVRDSSGKVLTERDPGFSALYRKELIRDNLKNNLDADGDHIMDFAQDEEDEDGDRIMGGLHVPKKKPKPGVIRQKADIKMKGPMLPDPAPDVEMADLPAPPDVEMAGPSKPKKGVAAVDGRKRATQVVINRVEPVAAQEEWPAVGPIAAPKKLTADPLIPTPFPKVVAGARRGSAPSATTGGDAAKVIKRKNSAPDIHKTIQAQNKPDGPKRFGKAQRNRAKDIRNARVAPAILASAPPVAAPSIVPFKATVSDVVPRRPVTKKASVPKAKPVRKPAGAKARATYTPHTMEKKRKAQGTTGGGGKKTRVQTDKNTRKRGDPFNPHTTSKKTRK